MEQFVQQEATQDFNKARSKEIFSRIMNTLKPSRHEMLSLQEVREIVKPKSESYKGMQVVPIAQIVGSEGRYRDFNRSFLPRRESLRRRWTSVDRAHLSDVILPPIKLYEIGGVYFVRDGNHRVSVARSQGVQSIDAEVTSLGSEIKLSPDLTRENMREAVIEYEKKRFFKETGFQRLFPDYDLQFTETGRYDAIIDHINHHKYYINQHQSSEIPFEAAIKSWYKNVFRPVADVIEEERVTSRFPGRTAADLYVWTVKHWDELKRRYGQQYPLKEAVRDYNVRFGRSLWSRLKDRLFGRSGRPDGEQGGP